jgi:hypothetical protein
MTTSQAMPNRTSIARSPAQRNRSHGRPGRACPSLSLNRQQRSAHHLQLPHGERGARRGRDR